MQKVILLIPAAMLSLLTLQANSDGNENGFTVTYLMMEREHIEIPQDFTVEESNSSQNITQQDGGAM